MECDGECEVKAVESKCSATINPFPAVPNFDGTARVVPNQEGWNRWQLDRVELDS